MSSIQRDPRNGNWLARWRDPSGKSRSKSFARKAEAQRFLSQLEANMHRGDYIDPKAATIRVQVWAEQWMKGQSHLKPSTRQRYEGIVRVYIVPTWGAWQLGKVAPSDVRTWISRLLDDGLAPSTIRQTVRVLSLIFDAAVLDGRLGRNPVKGVRLPRTTSVEPRCLAPRELGDLVRAAGDQGTSVLFLAVTGLRFGELAALRVRRVDIERCRVTVAESVTEIGGRLVWTTPKTHARRSVPFPPSLVPVVEPLLEGKSPDDPVFTSPDAGPLRLSNWRRRVFQPACAAAGIEGLRVHDLRHTAASLAISSGANVKAVQRMLGHRSAAMTLDVYAGLFGDDLDAVAASIGGLVGQMWDNGPKTDQGPATAEPARAPEL